MNAIVLTILNSILCVFIGTALLSIYLSVEDEFRSSSIPHIGEQEDPQASSTRS